MVNLDTSTLLSWVFSAPVFAAVVVAVFAFNRFVEQRKQQNRFKDLMGTVKSSVLPQVQAPKASRWMDSLYKLSLPSEGWGESSIRLKFLRAGFRQSDAPRIYYAVKSILVLVVPLLLVKSATLPVDRMTPLSVGEMPAMVFSAPL